MHIWFEAKFGEPYTALSCTAEALERFTSATFAVGVRLEPDDRLRVEAPFGLADLFALRLRPNPRRKTPGFARSCANVLRRWPELVVENERPSSNEPLRVERVVAELPSGFYALRVEARAEGYRHLERLADEWMTRAMRFDREGEMLLAARLARDLAGIGGLTVDPAQPGALRMRRFYVRRSSRRNGIGRALAENLLAHARALGRPVTVNAAAGSEFFWQSLGFVAEPRDGHTHVLPYC